MACFLTPCLEAPKMGREFCPEDRFSSKLKPETAMYRSAVLNLSQQNYLEEYKSKTNTAT